MEILSGIIATVMGGIILTFIFFLFKEVIFTTPKISGKWDIETKVKTTAYNPYKDMLLQYEAILWLEGDHIEGTMEKVYEKSKSTERTLVGEQRTRAEIKGSLQKRYFSQSKVFLHVIEYGEGREFTTYYELNVIDNILLGSFISTAASSDGSAIWKRKEV